METHMKLSIKTLTVCLALLVPLTSHAATFNVTSTIDRIDATPGDGLCATAIGLCTLRAAVMEANADATSDTINVAAGTYHLSRRGAGEDSAYTGDLDITNPVMIVGSDATDGTAPVIDGLTRDRVFHVHAAAANSTINNLTINSGLIRSSTDNAQGGAILIDSAADITIDDVVFFNNKAITLDTTSLGIDGFGGALAALNATDLLISNSSFLRNSAEGTGFSGAKGYGGALYFSNSTGVVSDSELSRNAASQNGGGVWMNDGFDFDNVAIKNNTADTGAGIYMYYVASDVTITNAEISANTATNSGGGLYVHYCGASSTNIVNSTISGNTATNYFGGGIYLGSTVTYACSANIYSSTIVENEAGYYGGGIYNTSHDLTMTNTILALNSAAVSGGDCNGEISSDGYNLLGDTDSCVYTSNTGDQTGSSSAGTAVDPLIDALANNGGDIQTHALLAGSPAIDAGNPAGCVDDSGTLLVYDQRDTSYNRTVDGDADGTATCDIGAYEVQ